MNLIKPWNICMKPSKCIICGENKNIKVLHFGRLNGIFYCNNSLCKKTIKKNIIDYINDSMNIPLYGLIDKESNEYLLILSFFSKSKNIVYKGILNMETINFFCIRKIEYKDNTKKLTIKLEYNDNNKIYSRYVGLDNILFHNENFYNKLYNCINLFGNKDIIISYKELSEKIRNTIYIYNLENLKKESSEFLF